MLLEKILLRYTFSIDIIYCCEKLQAPQKEAVTIILHHLAITVANGTDIFMLLLHFTFTGDIKSEVYMQPRDKELSARSVNITAASQSHIKIMPNILAAHGLSGYDTVCSYFGIGKKNCKKYAE